MMENLQPAIEAMEAFDAIHKVIGNLMEGFHDIPAMLELLCHGNLETVAMGRLIGGARRW
jgi:hypothetical protein